jgi:hypothetical protein
MCAALRRKRTQKETDLHHIGNNNFKKCAFHYKKRIFFITSYFATLAAIKNFLNNSIYGFNN